jgi:hypothetical protein
MADAQARSVVPTRYIEALEGADPIESLRKAPKRFKKLLKGLSEKQLAKRPAEGQWSIKEVIAHLADGEVISGSRMRFVAAQPKPVLIGYDQDLFVANLGVERVKTKDLLEAFEAARALNVALLARLPEGALTRVGMHSERGEESLEMMVSMYAGHDLVHERQILASREAIQAAKSEKKEKKRAQKKLAEKRAKLEEARARAEKTAADAGSDEKHSEAALKKPKKATATTSVR